MCNNEDDDCDGDIDEELLNVYFLDADGDGFGSTEFISSCELPDGYVENNEDCNDDNSSVNPGASEVCNGEDDNCDSNIDEGLFAQYFQDLDGDNVGGSIDSLACSAPFGYVSSTGDCDDTDSEVYPGAVEVCNDIDDDCDIDIDEGLLLPFYSDLDGDGYGDINSINFACEVPNGFVSNPDDCDDDDTSINPGAAEICGNLFDENCNGLFSEGCTSGCMDPLACNYSESAQESDGSCFYPSEEICNDLDDDCDGEVDEGLLLAFFADADNDGFGDSNSLIQACTTPEGYVADSTDCNDGDFNINPTASEICGNATDENCDGVLDNGCIIGCMDVAACNFNSFAVVEDGSCIYPSTEICNEVDDDCDGDVDEGVQNVYYADVDLDGFGNAGDSVLACMAPDGFVIDSTDCVDSDAAINPSAMEICGNSIDENCDGQTSEGCLIGCMDPLACNYVESALEDDGSCVYSAEETCNDVDDDCDGTIDEGCILGCTDSTAFNYDSLATIDDGTCIETIIGCSDSSACNFDFNVNVNDSSLCLFPPNDPVILSSSQIGCGETQGIVVLESQGDALILVNGVENESNDTLLLNEGIWMIQAVDTNYTGCLSDTVIVEIIVLDDCNPQTVNDTLMINEDEMGSINVVLNDSDGDNNLDVGSVDLDPETPGIQTAVVTEIGSWSVDNAGNVSFVPFDNLNGVDSVAYTISDSTGLTSSVAWIYVIVNPVNDAPVLPLEFASLTTSIDTPITICLEASDVDGDSLSIGTVIGNQNGAISGLGDTDTCFVYTPNNGFVGLDSMWVTVCDSALCDTIWIWINIEDVLLLDAVNDAAVSDSGSIEIDILANDLFTDINDLTITIVSTSGNASVEFSNGVLVYSPSLDYCGLDSLSYSICNGQGQCDTAWVLIQVTPMDSDGDGIPDYLETLTLDTDGDGVLNYLSIDSDGDGLLDSAESGLQDICSSILVDCDEDGVPDYLDEDKCEEEVVIPEGLSPNGDGVNDDWIIPNIDQYPDNEVVIYNRWGNVVYQAQPYKNDWSGECNQAGLVGKNLLPEGTYFYVVRLRREEDVKLGYLYIKR